MFTRETIPKLDEMSVAGPRKPTDREFCDGLYLYCMQIPDTYPGFKKKTLVVTADHVHANIYKGMDHELIFVTTMESNYPPNGGGERSSMMTPSGLHTAESREKDTIISEDHLFHALAKDLHERLEKGEFEELILAAGEEIAQLEALLHPDVKARLVHSIPKLLTRFDESHLLEHLWG